MHYIDEFKEDLMESFKSDKTISAYLVDIEQFLNFIKDKDLKDLKVIDIEYYKKHLLINERLNVNTINRKLIAIGRFLKFNKIIIPIRQVKVHTQNFLDNILDDEDIDRLVKKAEEHNDYRAKALILTLKYTGMRVSEMLQLTVDDIHKDTIMIVGKGDKRRNVLIPKKLREIWKEYVKHRINKTNMLFTGKRGCITRNTVYNIIQEYAELSAIDSRKAHPHNLRHYYCKTMTDKGVPIEDVADIVGHTDINITRIYTRRSKKELLDIVNDI